MVFHRKRKLTEIIKNMLFYKSWGCSSVGLWLVEPTAHRGERLNGYFIYILRRRKEGSFYIGQTNNINNRLDKHNKGQIRSTKHRVPFDLIYSERYNTRREAMLREKHLKSLAGLKEKKIILQKLFMQSSWGCSSVGRALEWHSRGRRFDPDQLHQ
jgi:putative endonuclease